MSNGMENNDATYNLPPPGGGVLVEHSTNDDTANGNSINSVSEGTDHAFNAVRVITSDALMGEEDNIRPSISSSLAVGGARPKVKSIHASKHSVPPTQESTVDQNFQHVGVHSLFRSLAVSGDCFDEPPSYEAAMAMANSSNAKQNISTELNDQEMIYNLDLLKGRNCIKYPFLNNCMEESSIANGHCVENKFDKEEFHETVNNDGNNESDTEEDDINDDDDELTADLPKSFYVLDVGSDSEGGNSASQGVSRAGQSNLSSEVAQLLIQSEMVAQPDRHQKNQQRRRGAENRRLNSRRRHVAQRRDIPNGEIGPSNPDTNQNARFNGLNAHPNEAERIAEPYRNGNITPDEEADFLEMDFEPDDSEDSDDSGDSGRGADETTDGNDAAEDLDEFVHDHGFGAVGGVINDYSHDRSHINQSKPEHQQHVDPFVLNNHVDDDLPRSTASNNYDILLNNIGSLHSQKNEEPDSRKALTLPLAVTTTLNGASYSNSHEQYSAQGMAELNSERTKHVRVFCAKPCDSNGKVVYGNELKNGMISAPLQSPAGKMDNNDDLTNASLEPQDMAMVRSRSLNSSLSATLKRASSSRAACADSPCLLMQALAKVSESDPGNSGGFGIKQEQYIKKRHISDNEASALDKELLENTSNHLPGKLPEDPKVNMEACKARLSQREALVFGVPYNGCPTNNESFVASNSHISAVNAIGVEQNQNYSPIGAQIRSNLDPFQELSWISATLSTASSLERNESGESQQESPTDEMLRSLKISDRLYLSDSPVTEKTNTIQRMGIRNIDRIEKIMIWTELEACKRQVNQVGVSLCGATALINVLQALDWPHDIDDVISKVPTRLRANMSPVAEYLVSRSHAGTNHRDLIEAMNKLTDEQIYGRFFHMFPERNFCDAENPDKPKSKGQEIGSFARWLGKWIRKGTIN